MSFKKTIPFLIACFFCLASINTSAQENLIGDTIFINAEAEIQVNFPTLPNSFSSVPKNAPFTIKGIDNGVILIAKSENFKPASLLVSEGGRNHQFVIAFKKEINYNVLAELVYDYSTEKKLQKRIREIAAGKSSAPKNPVVNAEPVKEPQKQAEPIAPKPADNSAAYYSLLEEGDKHLKDQRFQEAKSSFDKAHQLRPDDAIPLQRLEEVKTKMSAAENKSGQLERDKRYLALTTNAKIYLDQKKYDQAKDAYKQALDLRPGDLYATHQLEIIDKAQADILKNQELQKAKSLYKDYMAQGEKALNKNQLTEARAAFEQALINAPNDPTAQARIKSIDQKEKTESQKLEIENNYNTLVQNADKYFQGADYTGAKIEYAKALAVFKRPWPQEQIARIDKILRDQAEQEKIDNQKQQQRLTAERQEKEKQALEDNYNAAIQSADLFFKQADYENAKIQYNKALDFIKRDWPRDQLIAINKLTADQVARENSEKQAKQKQELENKYTASIGSADKLYQSGDYDNAKAEYNKAMSIISKPYPQEQIKRINVLLAEKQKEANAEKVRLAQEAELTARYTTVIKNADAEYDKSNYLKAKKLYSDAAKLKPAENFPKESLTAIDNIFAQTAAAAKAKKDSLDYVKELNRKYNLALSAARSKFQKDDLENAKIFYEEAAGLKPGEDEPKSQLSVINKKLAEIAKETELNNSYEQKVALADSLLILKMYDGALAAYNEALAIKPAEKYPPLQIKYVQSELADNKVKDESRKKEEEELRYKNALARAKKAYADKNYYPAKSAFEEALSIHPNNKDALRSLEILNNQLSIARADSLSHIVVPKDTVAVKSKKKKKNKPVPVQEEKAVTKQNEPAASDNDLPLQATSVPYTKEELKAKYPTIDLSVLPADQPFNQTAVYSKDNLEIYRAMLLEKPRLNLNSTDKKIKLICDGINFQEGNAYVKLRIQNYSNEDFLTGAMMVSWTKKAGNLIKLYPNHLYPSPLPVIQPGHEARVIYSFKTYDIADDEQLSFELIDRLKNVVLRLQITGSTFNQERSR